MLDDEGEGDRHHGEIGTGHADGRHRQQRADDAGDEPAAGSASQKLDALECEDADGVGADGIEADVADGDLAGRARPGC